MKEWWINLALREKQMLALGMIAIIFALSYYIIWSPINNKTETLRKQIQQDKELLVWMQNAETRIKSLEKNIQKTSAQNTSSILGVVQTELNQSSFGKNTSQLKQGENNSVQVNFVKVNFDDLIVWLTMLWQKHGIVVAQINVLPGEKAGIVSGSLGLSRAE